MSKKILSCILVLSMVLSLGTPAFANSYSADIDIELEPLIMDVNVPTQLPLAFDESGDMTVVGNATITNNGIAQVEITDITLIPAMNWELTDWSKDYTSVPVGTKEFAFKINDRLFPASGELDVLTAGFEPINGKGGTLDFTYQGKVAPQKDIETVTVGSVVFTVSWVESELIGYEYNGVTLPLFPEHAGHPYVGLAYMSSFNTYSVAFLSEHVVYADLEAQKWMANGESEMIQYVLNTETNEWEYIHTADMEEGLVFTSFETASFTYANFDIYDTDGNIYLAASKLTPIYE